MCQNKYTCVWESTCTKYNLIWSRRADKICEMLKCLFLSFPFSFFLVCFVDSLLEMARYRTWDLPMNNEILSRAGRESRHVRKCTGKNKSATTTESRVALSFLSWKRGAQPPSRHSRGGLFPQAISVIFLPPRWACHRFRFFFFDSSLARTRERVTSCILYRENHFGCCFPGHGWWWERRRRRRRRRGYGGRRATTSSLDNEKLSSSFGRLSDSMRCHLHCDVEYI